MSRVVCDSFFYVIEKKQHYRLKTGLLFANLLRSEKIQLNDYINGLKEVLPQADDLKIDIPKIWDCLAELLVDVICEEVLPLRELHSCCHVLIEQKQADKLLAPLFKLMVSRKGPMFLSSIWKQSNLRVEDFVSDNVTAGFIQDNQLEFLVGGKIKMSFEEMQEALCKVISTSSEIDSISNWISSNIEGQLKENTFIRALATAITIVSLDNKSKLSLSKLTAFQKLITLYVDNDSNKEMQYLYAIQTLINKMEHPQGLLLQICNCLYDMGVISEESFLAWEKDEDPAEQAGKGVALKQLTSFFTQLKENDEDEEDEGSASGN
ncbi:eukaryotic translation initiation factor 4 gamma 3-like [Leptinotarsa decemlineata]|uniref:eukaryotic translation initiation factor 4 gamma 3-like n=1 Tax=Leptinotarsa decemlineata TaxID=7539 RepID=UPI003D308D12